MDKEESGLWGKGFSIVIALAMILSGIIIVSGDVEASNDVSETGFVPSDTGILDVGSDSDIYLVDICAPPYYRPAFTDKDNQLELKLKNNGDTTAHIKIDLYHVEPDKISESFLKSMLPLLIPSGQGKTFNAFKDLEDKWQPTEIGRNWIRGEIYILNPGEGWVLASEFKESFWVMPGSRPILELGNTVIDKPTVWENLTVIIDGDLTIAESAKLSTFNSDVFAADLNVSGSYDIPAGFTFNLECSSDGEYAVRVKSSGTLNVYGNITNDPDNHRYWFYMNGTLNIGKESPADDPGLVEFAYGDTSNLSNPGGIICTTPNVNI